MDHWKLQKDVGVFKAYFYTAKTYFFKYPNYHNNESSLYKVLFFFEN